MVKSRPYVILSAAISLDGNMATKTGDSRLSSKKDLVRVHKLRSNVDAILIGKRTMMIDDPSFTYLTVKEGSSIIIVRFPISIASTFDLSLCTLTRSFFEDSLESPVFVAIFPSKLMAALSITYGLDFTMYYFTTNHYCFDYGFRCSVHN